MVYRKHKSMIQDSLGLFRWEFFPWLVEPRNRHHSPSYSQFQKQLTKNDRPFLLWLVSDQSLNLNENGCSIKWIIFDDSSKYLLDTELENITSIAIQKMMVWVSHSSFIMNMKHMMTTILSDPQSAFLICVEVNSVFALSAITAIPILTAAVRIATAPKIYPDLKQKWIIWCSEMTKVYDCNVPVQN